MQAVKSQTGPTQTIGMISDQGYTLIELLHPQHNLPVGSLQNFLDGYLKAHPEIEIDYVHGDESIHLLGKEKGNCGFYLPAISKDSFSRQSSRKVPYHVKHSQWAMLKINAFTWNVVGLRFNT